MENTTNTLLDSNLLDSDSNFIMPLLVVAVVVVLALLGIGFFMPSPDWIF